MRGGRGGVAGEGRPGAGRCEGRPGGGAAGEGAAGEGRPGRGGREGRPGRGGVRGRPWRAQCGSPGLGGGRGFSSTRHGPGLARPPQAGASRAGSRRVGASVARFWAGV